MTPFDRQLAALEATDDEAAEIKAVIPEDEWHMIIGIPPTMRLDDGVAEVGDQWLMTGAPDDPRAVAINVLYNDFLGSGWRVVGGRIAEPDRTPEQEASYQAKRLNQLERINLAYSNTLPGIRRT